MGYRALLIALDLLLIALDLLPSALDLLPSALEPQIRSPLALDCMSAGITCVAAEESYHYLSTQKIDRSSIQILSDSSG